MEVNSLLIFGVNMSDPEKMVFLDFLLPVTKGLETIRADVESTQLVIQAIGNERGILEKAVVSVDTFFRTFPLLKIGAAIEAGG